MKNFIIIFSLLLISACGKSGDETSSTSAQNDVSVSDSNSTGYNKIDWQTMDTDQDGYVSPEEMVNHYNSTGVYK